jgi:hypothetical protein
VQKEKLWQALNIFAGEDILQQLLGSNIDSLENIIILQHDVHIAFGKMNLWFTPDDVSLCSMLLILVTSKPLSP